MKEYVFTTEGPNITAKVWPTLQALGDQPWRVQLLDSYGKQIASRVIEAESGLGAATDAVMDWLESNGYNSGFAVYTLT